MELFATAGAFVSAIDIDPTDPHSPMYAILLPSDDKAGARNPGSASIGCSGEAPKGRVNSFNSSPTCISIDWPSVAQWKYSGAPDSIIVGSDRDSVSTAKRVNPCGVLASTAKVRLSGDQYR
tara:strand:+ start:602 stop:967 length:366 start_codon:yes stop_codon:yes gene_type:complete